MSILSKSQASNVSSSRRIYSDVGYRGEQLLRNSISDAYHHIDPSIAPSDPLTLLDGRKQTAEVYHQRFQRKGILDSQADGNYKPVLAFEKISENRKPTHIKPEQLPIRERNGMYSIEASRSGYNRTSENQLEALDALTNSSRLFDYSKCSSSRKQAQNEAP